MITLCVNYIYLTNIIKQLVFQAMNPVQGFIKQGNNESGARLGIMRSNVLVRHQGLSSEGMLNEDVDEMSVWKVQAFQRQEVNNIFVATLISLKVTLQLLLTQHSKYKLGGKKHHQQQKLYTSRSKPDVQVSTNLITSYYCTETSHFSNSKQNWAL